MCGTWDVDALAAAIPATVLQRWAAYEEWEPLAGRDEWRQFGEVWAAVYNARPFQKPGGKAAAADMIGPKPPKPPVPAAVAAANRAAVFKAMAAATAGMAPAM